jgi:L,D-peptidoglycan transpeptidase YkuD (ErfK/YbiS/YcfS/YnhG family)
MAGHVGRSGLSANRTEGDGTTPSGTFSLTEAFGIQPYDAAKLPYRTVGPYDWWVSDSQAPDYYNTFQTTTPSEGNNPIHWRASAAEHLITFGRAYNYAAVINYNRPPTVPRPVPGLGSAIFLHVDTGKPTSGCVSIGEDQMKSVLSWLDPTKHPAIIIGTDDDLLTADGAAPVIGTTAQGIDYVAPTRVLDTRDGTGRPGRAVGPVGTEQFIDLQVVPTVSSPVADGVPSNATAVALNLTLTGATADTFLTVFPTPGDGSNPPLVSNVNALPREDRANLVLVGVQPGTGMVRIYNKHGSAHVVADVVGYVSPTSTGRVQPVNPYRIVDTRDGTGVTAKDPLGAGAPITVTVPFAPAHATAVIANVTVVDPTDATWLAAFGGQAAWAGTSTVNTKASETSANLAVMPLGPGNTVTVLNHWGKADVVVDVAGFVLADGSRYVPAKIPQRVLDTRAGLSIRGRIGSDETINLQIPGLPRSATAVALTVTGVNPSEDTHLTVQAAGTATVQVSNVNLSKGSTRANLVIVPVTDGVISIRNKNGSIDLVGDVSGWFEP